MGSYGVSLWKAIHNEAGFLKKRCSIQLGKGERIRFWKDGWCDDNPLCINFPNLYSIASTKRSKLLKHGLPKGTMVRGP